MQPAVIAAVVMFILSAGALAALLGRSRGEAGGPRRTTWWQVVAFCSVAVAVAVLVLALYA